MHTDIDECDSNPCQNNGTCNDEVNGYTCTCAAGFTGTECAIGIFLFSKLSAKIFYLDVLLYLSWFACPSPLYPVLHKE